jgi:hypothetical protein
VPPQQWAATAVDNRTFGQQIQRLLDDIDRPNLAPQATTYLQDSMRYYARKPFFFSDTDNTSVLSYANSVIVTQGTTIVATPSGGSPSYMVALNAGTTAAAGTPAWPSTVFVPPSDNSLPPPVSGTAGTVTDNAGPNQIIWANNGLVQNNLYTQLSTVYSINQYVMPIDLIAFTRVEVTWQNSLRIEMTPLSYRELRDFDVIRPTPPTTYPSWYAFYQQQLYLWPYPVGLYQITLSYRGTPPLAYLATDSNVWTTKAEALIRYEAEGRMQRELIHDEEAAETCFAMARQEFLTLQSQDSQQNVRAGIPPSDW